MKKVKKSTVKIAAATSMCIFSLASVFSATIAWFNMMQQEAAYNEAMSAEVTERFSKISYYNFTGTPTDDSCNFSLTPYASISYNRNTKKFDKPVDGSGNELQSFDLVMQQYDPMNKHKPILVIAELIENVDVLNGVGVQVIAKTSTTDFLGAKDENHQNKYSLGSDSALKIDTVGGVDYYPLSSVACFRSKAFSADDYNSWISGKSSYEVTGLTSNDTTWKHPIDHNFSEADVDHDSSSFYNESTVYRSDSAVNRYIKYIAVVVDYYDIAVEYIYSTFLGNDTLENDYNYILNFTCDWRWEIG